MPEVTLRLRSSESGVGVRHRRFRNYKTVVLTMFLIVIYNAVSQLKCILKGNLFPPTFGVIYVDRTKRKCASFD